MKKWLVFVVLLGLVVGGYLVHSKYRQGSEIAGEYEARTLLPREIEDALESDSPARRADAADQIESLPQDRRRVVLLALSNDDRAPVRLLAASLLGKGFAGDAEVADRLLALAREDLDGDVKAAALEALQTSGDPRVLTLAAVILADSEASLAARLQAAEALDGLTGRTTVTGLTGHVEEAQDAADDLGMEWDGWVKEHGAKLRWDAEKGRFVEGE